MSIRKKSGHFALHSTRIEKNGFSLKIEWFLKSGFGIFSVASFSVGF